MGDMVKLDRVSKTFRTGRGEVEAVRDVSLSVDEGEIFGIIGYSGAGKSTLVRLINGLERVTEGRVVVDGIDITTLRERDLRAVRTGIGMIFQQFNLFRSRTVEGNIAYPLRIAGWDAEARAARVNELLEFVGLTDRRTAYPDQLSGGQKQRVGIARALAANPKILLADESTSALDPETTAEVLRLLRRVNREFGVTIVVITHEMEVVRSICDHVAVMSDGRIVEQGSVFDIFSAPQSETAKSFVATVVHDRPAADDIDRLRREHPGRIVTVHLPEGTSIGPVLGGAETNGVQFDIVHGGVSALQGRSFGSLTLSLRGTEAETDAFLARLADVTTYEEVPA